MALGCALAFALNAAPAAAVTGSGVVGKVQSSGSHAARGHGGAGYWTPARIRSARPLDVAPPGSPQPLRKPRGPRANETLIDDTTSFPASTNGKVFFKMGHNRFECSGTAVDSANESAVFTAGHCVYGGGKHGRWAKRWTFIPGYNEGARPFGSFEAKELWSTKRWVRRKDFSEDIGSAIVSTNNTGQRLVDVAGGREIAFDQPRQQSFQVFGYPAAGAFDGLSMWECDADFAGTDVAGIGPADNSLACHLPGGASGGGWIIGGRFLDSVTSYGYTGFPETVYGPYFGSAARNLFEKVAG